jgi:C4-dicarboxylate-specific signal transduction histidine kinase
VGKENMEQAKIGTSEERFRALAEASEESDDFHILFVRDNGVGIGKDHCEKVFRP